MSEAQPKPAGRRALWAGAAVLLLAGFYIRSYGDCMQRFFYLDDFVIIDAADRIALHSPLDLVQFMRPLPGSPMYRPLTTVGYFYALRRCFGNDPTGFHAVQLAFQVVNALLVYAVATTLLGSPALGLATAVVYATAPGHALAACWNAAFSITGTASFCFLALWVWLCRGRWRGTLVFVLSGLALLASEHAVSLPVLLTLSTLLLEPRARWPQQLRTLVPLYVIGGLYLGTKLYYVRFLLPLTFPTPAAQAFARQGYALSLHPSDVLGNLGRYLGFSLPVAYRATRVGALAVAAGALLVAAAVLAGAFVLTGRWTSRWLRVMAFGLNAFIVALLPVVVLRTHVASYYVGVAALGSALAVIAGARALPRGSEIAPGIAAVLLVLCHFWSTAGLVRNTEEFRLFEVFSERAASWLYTLAIRVDPQRTTAVVLPRDAVTSLVFDSGHAQRSFLCAPYEVRTSDDVEAIEPAPGRVVLRTSAPLPPGSERWSWLPRACTP